ncbi:alpha/beta hydrolase-fold protein [Parvularcula lutaonensis]|uniref:Alpha/beta hydrolase-fold protein n=1 Tax=Parvularcula lutaonensis TaxID=491923 RepID=A0ABV7M882_9PROT|nr:alpha/beta hydrolase-fold protein [Parvularcula lutaonensis]GGY43271.1 hypothetical protein GCM10007148_09980 [Parvularcula lutaonensis]
MKRLLLVLALLVPACTEEAPIIGDDKVSVTVIANVPAATGPVYLAGSIEELGPWDANGLIMQGQGTERTATFSMDDGEELQYKFTLGEWSREAVDENKFPLDNFILTASEGLTVEHDIAGFRPDMRVLMDDWEGSGVIGTLVYEQDVESAFLELPRHLSVWLPRDYDAPENASRRYRVIYMTDGQNLFDPRIANTGTDWGVDEAMMRGVEAGEFESAIIVATWSTDQRFEDYSPWHNGPQYARFLKEELKPRIDAAFRTLPERENTFAMGSSMGGLMAMYLVTSHGDTFSACGCVSTHTPLSPNVVAEWTGEKADPTPYLTRDIEEGRLTIPEGVRMFFDYGTETLDAEYGPGHEELRRFFTSQGLEEGEDFLIREYPGAAHNEAAWRARVGDQLTWMLAGNVPLPQAGAGTNREVE